MSSSMKPRGAQRVPVPQEMTLVLNHLWQGKVWLAQRVCVHVCCVCTYVSVCAASSTAAVIRSNTL